MGHRGRYQHGRNQSRHGRRACQEAFPDVYAHIARCLTERQPFEAFRSFAIWFIPQGLELLLDSSHTYLTFGVGPGSFYRRSYSLLEEVIQPHYG